MSQGTLVTLASGASNVNSIMMFSLLKWRPWHLAMSQGTLVTVGVMASPGGCDLIAVSYSWLATVYVYGPVLQDLLFVYPQRGRHVRR